MERTGSPVVCVCAERAHHFFQVDLNYFSHFHNNKKWHENGARFFSPEFAHIYIVFCLTKTSGKFNQNLLNLSFFLLFSPSLFSSLDLRLCLSCHSENMKFVFQNSSMLKNRVFFFLFFTLSLSLFRCLTLPFFCQTCACRAREREWAHLRQLICLVVFNERAKLKFETFASHYSNARYNFWWCTIFGGLHSTCAVITIGRLRNAFPLDDNFN